MVLLHTTGVGMTSCLAVGMIQLFPKKNRAVLGGGFGLYNNKQYCCEKPPSLGQLREDFQLDLFNMFQMDRNRLIL